MWFFGLMFWLLVICLVAAAARRRRWERWAMMGPGGYGRYGGWWERRDWRGRNWGDQEEAPARRRELEEQRTYIETLENRLAELEERLDFTERLLQGRQEQAGTP
ncbi:MAG: hypothetical protein ACREMX_12915 [Gemmatimonadales bacterium]